MDVHRAPVEPDLEGETPLAYLFAFCHHHDLKVTSGERILPDGTEILSHGGHVNGSLHYVGRAVDVSVHLLSQAAGDHLIQQANELGINVLDERQRPDDGTPWTGPHMHLSISPPGTRAI